MDSGLPGYQFPNMQKFLVTVSGEEKTKAGKLPMGENYLVFTKYF